MTPPIDRRHLLGQMPELLTCRDILAGYLAIDLELGLNPTRYFETEWYAWQNPDWTEFAHPYLHFWQKGRFQGRDPSPRVDVYAYRQAIGNVAPEDVYTNALSGLHAPALGIYEDWNDLEDAQDRVRAGICVFEAKVPHHLRKRSALVVLQAGRQSLMANWFEDQERQWDLWINYYDAAGCRADNCEYQTFQKGTKFTSMANLWARYGEVISAYEHVLFLDDDVSCGCADLNHLFRKCRQGSVDLGQMALSAESSCNWDELFHKRNSKQLRNISAVEIMMPVFSRRALQALAPSFSASISGFGLDLVWGTLAREAGLRVALVNDAIATHARPVDQTGGAYYRYLRKLGINAKAELWYLLKEYGAEKELTAAA